MIRAILPVAALLFAGHAAVAQQANPRMMTPQEIEQARRNAPPPPCGEPRGRLAVVAYRPLTMYECFISPDVATSIVVSGDEQIGPIAPADKEHFIEFRRSENLLALQPKAEEVNKSPNMTFVTKNTKTGETRNYFFLFHVSALPVGMAAIQFIYPEDEKLRRAEVASAQSGGLSQTVLSTLATAPFYSGGDKKTKGGMNWDYDCMCGSGRDIKPDHFADNGQDTTFEYRGSRSSAIVVARLDRDGTEKPGELPKIETVVNFTPLTFNSTTYVIPEVAEYWMIRSGSEGDHGEVDAIRNNAYHPEQNDLRTGTQSPYVVRRVKPTPKPLLPARTAQR